jgi:uncharacterized membrane protein
VCSLSQEDKLIDHQNETMMELPSGEPLENQSREENWNHPLAYGIIGTALICVTLIVLVMMRKLKLHKKTMEVSKKMMRNFLKILSTAKQINIYLFFSFSNAYGKNFLILIVFYLVCQKEIGESKQDRGSNRT